MCTVWWFDINKHYERISIIKLINTTITSNSRRWWGQPGELQSMGSRRVGHDLVSEQQQHLIFILFLWWKHVTPVANFNYTIQRYQLWLPCFTILWLYSFYSWKYVPFTNLSKTSLVVQWLRIHLLTQGTWAWSLVQEAPTFLGTIKPVCHKKRSHCSEKVAHHN